MEELRKKHKAQHKDLQAKLQSKRRNATKKTRRGVEDECAAAEARLKEQQDAELAELYKDPNGNGEGDHAHDMHDQVGQATDLAASSQDALDDTVQQVQQLSVSSTAAAAQTNGNETKRKPNRQKARLARRAAEREAVVAQAEEEAAAMPNEREKEMQAMKQVAKAHGLIEREIRSDGHCLYAAIADQLEANEIDLNSPAETAPATAPYLILRHAAASYMSSHPADFEGFLEVPLKNHTKVVKETGEWGGHPEIVALSRAYHVHISVLHGNGQVDKIETDQPSADTTILWLAYYQHNFGLGEHYNSLRRSKEG